VVVQTNKHKYGRKQTPAKGSIINDQWWWVWVWVWWCWVWVLMAVLVWVVSYIFHHGPHGPVLIQKCLLDIWIPFKYSRRCLGRENCPSKGHYLHRTAQHRKTRTYTHSSSGIRIDDPGVGVVENHTSLRPRGHWDRPQIRQVLLSLPDTL